jgi:hypothetical protein
MEFTGVESVVGKIVEASEVIEERCSFKYLGCEMSCRNNRGVEQKLNRTRIFCGNTRRTLGKKLRKETLLQPHKAVAVPSLTS